MDIRKSAYEEPLKICPYCKNYPCYASWVDNGFGPFAVQCGPFECDNCGALEIGPYDKHKELTKEENKTNWYEPIERL